MAELLAADGWIAPGSLAAYLREALPQEYAVVADPVVFGHRLDAVVVGPGGLIALRARRDAGDEAKGGGVRGEDVLGALRAFLRDEFPALHPSLRQLGVARDPGSDLPLWKVTEADAMTGATVADAILSPGAPPDPALANEAVRDDLAVALRDHQLTFSQRAAKPFVFRSGGALGFSTKAWTVRDAVAHMDRHPQDGIFHLANGTLEHWLREEGAAHLAKLAQEAVLEGKNDRRRALEIFLVGTGLVQRPRLAASPKRLDLGYVLDGASASGVLRIRRGRGRGYLFGHLDSSEPWLHIDPQEFGGKPVDVVVTADTGSLLIDPAPRRAAVLVDSSASAAPIAVPVQLRIVSTPSGFSRHVLRPLAGLLLAGLLGAGIGWLSLAAGAPAHVLPETGPLVPRPLLWILLLAAAWAILGAVRGFMQPQPWPITYASFRWLRRTLKWAVALSAVALLAAWGWGRGMAGGLSYGLAALSGLAAATLPATIGEIQSARAARNPALLTARRRVLGSAARGIAGVLLLLVLLAGPRWAAPAMESSQARGALQGLQAWVEGGWSRLNTGADDLVNRYTLRYYDRRAPEQPSGTPSPTREPLLRLPELKLP